MNNSGFSQMDNSCYISTAVAVGSSQCDDSTVMMPVKCFYRNAASRSNVVAGSLQVQDSVNRNHSTTQLEELGNGMTKQSHIVPAKTEQPYGGKHVKNESEHISADRKPKTVERKVHHKVKQVGRMKPPRAAICNTLIFKTLNNNLQLTERGKESANSASAPIEKENRLKDSHIKRFFKNRTTLGRKHVTSVAGRCVNIGSLSKLSYNKVSANSLSSGLAKSSPSGCSPKFTSSSTLCNDIGDVFEIDTVMTGAEINCCPGVNTEQKHSTHTTPDQSGVAPLQMSSSSGFETNLVPLEVTELVALPTKTKLAENPGLYSRPNDQTMLSSPSSTAAKSTPSLVALRSPGIRSSPRLPATPVSKRFAGKSMVIQTIHHEVFN